MHRRQRFAPAAYIRPLLLAAAAAACGERSAPDPVAPRPTPPAAASTRPSEGAGVSLTFYRLDGSAMPVPTTSAAAVPTPAEVRARAAALRLALPQPADAGWSARTAEMDALLHAIARGAPWRDVRTLISGRDRVRRSERETGKARIHDVGDGTRRALRVVQHGAGGAGGGAAGAVVAAFADCETAIDPSRIEECGGDAYWDPMPLVEDVAAMSLTLTAAEAETASLDQEILYYAPDLSYYGGSTSTDPCGALRQEYYQALSEYGQAAGMTVGLAFSMRIAEAWTMAGVTTGLYTRAAIAAQRLNECLAEQRALAKARPR